MQKRCIAATPLMISASLGSGNQSFYDNFDGYVRPTADLKNPVQIGRSFNGARELHKVLRRKGSGCTGYIPPNWPLQKTNVEVLVCVDNRTGHVLEGYAQECVGSRLLVVRHGKYSRLHLLTAESGHSTVI